MSMDIERIKCPNEKNHTERPDGYNEFFDWALEKAKTHNQTKCPECGLWAIWIPKGVAA